jgi:hypothetical protein
LKNSKKVFRRLFFDHYFRNEKYIEKRNQMGKQDKDFSQKLAKKDQK